MSEALTDHLKILLGENAIESGSRPKQQNIGRRGELCAMARVSCWRIISGSRCSSVGVYFLLWPQFSAFPPAPTRCDCWRAASRKKRAAGHPSADTAQNWEQVPPIELGGKEVREHIKAIFTSFKTDVALRHRPHQAK